MLLHCNAGKGRTGTAISAVLLFCGMIDNTNDALKYYAYKRFANGCGGVTQPCQTRYVKYMEELVKKNIRSSPPKVFKQMVINYLPTCKGDFKPIIEIYQYHYKNLVLSSSNKK